MLAGEAPGRTRPDSVTLFDSTGLAIQDLAIAVAAHDAVARRWGRGAARGAVAASLYLNT